MASLGACVYECVYQGARYVGTGVPVDGAPLRLYRLGVADLRVPVLAANGAGPALVAALTAARTTVVVPAGLRQAVRFRPPLLPSTVGDAVVSGFMRTHRVKADDGGAPAQPNWFFKGLGDVLKVSGEPLTAPVGAVAVCEEAEVVLVYVTDARGVPRYVGYTFGNDLTDIGRFLRHPGHLSYAKLCDTSVVPWLFLDSPPPSVTGQVVIERNGSPAWVGDLATGTRALRYAVPDMVAGLFRHGALLRPGRVHYVFLGADRGSFQAGFRIADQDRVVMRFSSHGVTLANTVRMP